MKSILKLLALAAVVGGISLSFTPEPVQAAFGEGGTCCDDESGTCYMVLEGHLIIQDDAYYEETGPCEGGGGGSGQT